MLLYFYITPFLKYSKSVDILLWRKNKYYINTHFISHFQKYTVFRNDYVLPQL